MDEMIVNHKGATHISEAQTATRTDHSHVMSPPTASDTKIDTVSVAVDFIDEYAMPSTCFPIERLIPTAENAGIPVVIAQLSTCWVARASESAPCIGRLRQSLTHCHGHQCISAQLRPQHADLKARAKTIQREFPALLPCP